MTYYVVIITVRIGLTLLINAFVAENHLLSHHDSFLGDMVRVGRRSWDLLHWVVVVVVDEVVVVVEIVEFL